MTAEITTVRDFIAEGRADLLDSLADLMEQVLSEQGMLELETQLTASVAIADLRKRAAQLRFASAMTNLITGGATCS